MSHNVAQRAGRTSGRDQLTYAFDKEREARTYLGTIPLFDTYTQFFRTRNPGHSVLLSNVLEQAGQ